MSGSDDGNFFIWDRKTAKLVNILEGDGEVVNVVQGHPYETMLAVSGIDDTIKVSSISIPISAHSYVLHRYSRPMPAPGKQLDWDMESIITTHLPLYLCVMDFALLDVDHKHNLTKKAIPLCSQCSIQPIDLILMTMCRQRVCVADGECTMLIVSLSKISWSTLEISTIMVSQSARTLCNIFFNTALYERRDLVVIARASRTRCACARLEEIAHCHWK